jgi:nucleotide-binding universal stress UspA family protein
MAAKLHAEIHVVSAVPAEGDVRTREHELSSVILDVAPAELTVLVADDPARAIHDAVVQAGRGVVCMATHGRGRSAALVGSVATELVARFHHPVVMVGPTVDLTERPDPWRIVVCVDESPIAAGLTRLAHDWASMFDADLTVITVAEPVPAPVGGGPAHRAFGPDGNVEAYLTRLLEDETRDDSPIHTTAVWDPVSPAEGAADYLDAHDAALVITSTHARVGFRRLALGSVAAALVHRSPAPVLMVPSTALDENCRRAPVREALTTSSAD